MKNKNLNSSGNLVLFETAPKVGKWEWDLETGIIYWSDELFRIFGVEPQSFVPTLDRGLASIYADDKEIAATAYQMAITKGEDYCIEKRIVKPNSELAIVLSIGTVIKNQQGKIIRLIDIFQDITETRKIEETLKQTLVDFKERNEFIEKIIECIPIGIAVNKIDNGEATLVNGRFSEIYGWREEEFTDIDAFFKKIYPDEAYRRQITPRIIEDIQSGDPDRMKWDNISITTSTGEKRRINAKNIPLFEQNLMISTVIDVTQAETQAAEIYRIKSNQDALINGTEDLIWSVDKNLRIISSNKAYREMIKIVTGKEPQEGDLVMTEEFGEDLNKKWEIYYQRALNGERFEVREQVFHLLRQRMEFALITFNPMFNESGELFGAGCYSKDITAETNNLRTLEITKAELQNIMDYSVDMICRIDANGTILNVSAASKKILGYAPDELTGKPLFDFIYQEDLEKTAHFSTRIMAGEEMIHHENRYVRKDGSLVYLTWSARWDPKDKIRYGIARDATEMKKSEAALLESEKKYKYLFENNPLPIFIWDFETGQIIDCNQETLLIYGYTREEFLKLTLRDLRLGEDIPLLEEVTQSEEFYLANNRKVWCHKKKNGDLINMDINGHLLDYNGRRSALVMAIDVTARLKAEEELKLSEAMLAEAQHLAKMGSWSFDFRTDHLTWSDELYNVFGTDKAGFLETHSSFLGFVDPEYRELVVATSKNTQQTGDAFNIIYTITTKTGEKKVIEEYGYGEKDKNGNIIRLFGNAQDVTARREAEALIVEANERFEYVTKATSDVIWDWDLEKNEVYYSDNMQKLFGHKPGVNNNNLPFYFEHVHPDDREWVVLYPDQVKYGDITNWEQEYRFRKADGNYAFIIDRGIVIRDENGVGTRMVGAMHDITNRKENEQKILKSGQQLDLIYNNVKDVIFVLSVEDEQKFMFISINQSFVDSTGIERDKIINKYVEDVIPEPSLSFVLGKYREVIDRKTKVTWEETTTYPTGTKTGIVNVTPIYDPDGICRQLIGSVYDITERKKEEQRMLLLESVITHTSDAVLITEAEPLDEPGPRIIYVNNAFTQMTGYSTDEVIGKSPRILQGPKTDKQELERLRENIRKWQPCEVTLINYKKYGEQFWVNLSVSYLFDDNGNPTHLIAIERDITQQKNEELQKLALLEAVAEAFEEKSTILESIDDAFFAVDKQWIVTYWNQMAAKLLGKPSNQMLDKNLWEVFPDFIGSESYKNYIQAAATNRAVHFEDYYSPFEKWMDISCYPSKNGLSVYFKDITERKLIEHQLSAERNLLRTLIDNLPHSVYFKDNNARKLISNKVDFELLGANTESDVLGKTDLEGFLPTDIASVAYEQDIMILNGGKPLINHEHTYSTKSGTPIWMLTTKIPLFNEINEVIGLLGIGRDITEQKLAEKKLRGLNADLEKSIQQLVVSNAELEQFAYVASHDLQEPLRMVTSFLTQLEKKYGDVLDDKGKQYIYFAVDGAKRMRQIILDLLDFSRVGRTEDDLEEVNFNKLINEILALYRRQIEELQASISFENLPTLQIYKTPVRQVFQNLIGNSLKYHKAKEAPVINITYKETKTHFQFAIKDNGIGISPEYFEKIFIIFQRLHNKDEYAGTGMGLAITKKIIESLGGKIWVQSSEGNGSIFYFTILKSNK